MAPGTRTRPRLQPVTIDDIIQTDVVTAQRDTPVATVAAEMAEKDVGCVVVVEDEAPVGIITDRSIALSLETTPDIADKDAEKLLSDDIVTGTTEMNVFEVVRRLDQESIRRLPVVDEDGSLAGIITLDDVLVLLGAELEHATSIIQSQSPRL
jgi:CBS domain-containing protein